MSKETEKFYWTRQWARTRTAYRKARGGLCERCLAKGIIAPGDIVHHKIHLTPENIGDVSLSLDFSNLELLCRDCHAAEHKDDSRYKTKLYWLKKKRIKPRYRINEDGTVST